MKKVKLLVLMLILSFNLSAKEEKPQSAIDYINKAIEKGVFYIGVMNCSNMYATFHWAGYECTHPEHKGYVPQPKK